MKYIIKRIGRSVEISEATSSLLVYRITYQNLSVGADEPIKIKNKFIVYILFGENNEGQDEMLDVLGLDFITYMDAEETSDADSVADDTASGSVPDGIYNMSWKLRRWGNKTAKGKMQVVGGKYIILAGSDVCPNEGHGLMDIVRMKRENANIVDDKLQEDIVLNSPSGAASFVTGAAANGWSTWRTEQGQMIDIFRNNQ